MSLNEAQHDAVEHRGSPLLVLAGAGTGKTRVITQRVATLIDRGEVEPWRILAVTFTNRAAAEMRTRIHALCQHENLRGLWVATFHSICARILREHGEGVGLTPRFRIYDTDDQVALMREVLRRQNVPKEMVTPKLVLGAIDRSKNAGLGPERVHEIEISIALRDIVFEAYSAYQRELRQADAVDFGDLLRLAVELLQQPAHQGQLADYDPVERLRTRFRHVVVDEFQDTNPVQAQLVACLSRNAELCVVGDDDQSIYGWRGADVDQIVGFADRHPGTKVVRLEQNYRSTSRILGVADAIIRNNRGRLGKTLWSELGDGDPVRVVRVEDERAEARLVVGEVLEGIEHGAGATDFAVFYRTHAQSRAIEEALRGAGLGCRIVGGVAFYARQEVKDVLAYLTVLENTASEVHLARVLNRPARGIGDTTLTKLREFAEREGIPLWSALGRASDAGVHRAGCRRIEAFRAMIEDLRTKSADMRFDELAEEVIEVTGYREMLARGEDGEVRLENLQELVGDMGSFAQENPESTLVEYLERVSLVGGENGEGDEMGTVTLMTVHSAKGLEFPFVYLVGMEERVFPHARVLEDWQQLEEERRLAYVAVTRAQQRLTLTTARRRRLYGQQQVGQPSRFLEEALQAEPQFEDRCHAAQAAYAAAPSREPQSDDDIVYDADAGGEEGTQIFVGMLVRHGRFGHGEVLGWRQDGSRLKLHLRFPAPHGTKMIDARYCEPA